HSRPPPPSPPPFPKRDTPPPHTDPHLEWRGGSGLEDEGDPETDDLGVLLQRKEKDLLLAAGLGKMLLEQNEELRGRCQALVREHADTLERLEQEKYELRRRLESEVAEWETRAAELEGDLAALRAQLGHQRLEQQDTSRESCQAVQELSEQNQRLAEQLSQASQLEQRLQDELMALRIEHRTLGMSSAEHAARSQSLKAENLMLQERKQDLERQTQKLRDENDAVQGLMEMLHENLLLVRRELREKEGQRLQTEAEELRVSNRQLQRRVREMTEELRLGDSDTSVTSLQSEIEASPVPHCGLGACPRSPPLGTPLPAEALSLRWGALGRTSGLRGPGEGLPSCASPIPSLCAQLTLQHVELSSLREELASQRRLFQESDRDETLKLAVADRDEAIINQMEMELAQVSLERDSMSQQLLTAIHQKMALSQELEAWQDDMQFIIHQQLQLQRQQERTPMSSQASPRTLVQAKTSPFFRRGNSAPNGISFLSLFKKS
uniref:BICD family-like cargo adapter 2 n=1 Tax=Pelusios castaneus TaxID=367368 RepID=A0A8C8S0L4_9SAUR